MTRNFSAVAVTASIGRPVEPARRIFAPGPNRSSTAAGIRRPSAKLLASRSNSFPAPLGAIRDVLRRYRVPGEDMEKGVREVEMPPRRGLAAIDPHGIERRQTTGASRHALGEVDHQNERAEVTLHDPRKTRGRSIPQSELTAKRSPAAAASSGPAAASSRGCAGTGKRRANLGRTEAGVFLTS